MPCTTFHQRKSRLLKMQSGHNTMLNLIGNILCSSIRNLFDNQPDIFDFTHQTGETEWNLVHHLANEIRKYIFWLDHDIDLTKRYFDSKRPDIIFHKRGITTLNFLAIEIKHRGADTSEDRWRVRNLWMCEPLRYRIGTSIKIIDRRTYDVSVFGNDTESLFNQDADYVPIPNVSQKIGRPFQSLVSKIFKEEKECSRSVLPSLKFRLDKMVYGLYRRTPEENEIGRESFKAMEDI